MENEPNNKLAIYWIIGIIVVIGLFFGFRYWEGRSDIVNNNLIENSATTTEDVNTDNLSGTIRPATSTNKTPVNNNVPVNNFDYKG